MEGAGARRGAAGMVHLGQALDLLFDRLGPLPARAAEVVPLDGAAGRILAEDVVAERALPDSPRSAMDGFAVASAALRGDAARVAGAVLAGEVPPALARGAALFVATGALLPDGADAVIPREWAEWEASGTDPGAPPAPGTPVRFRRPATPGANVLQPGEWVAAGVPALRAGTRLLAPAVGLLAALGRRSVRARRRPLVAILATGDELVAAGQPLRPGASYESNAPMLRAACLAAGAEVVALPAAADTPAALDRALRSAMEPEPALVLTSGGVSVGPADLVPAAWRALGAEEIFWRVAMKPGKPVFAARLGGMAVLGLSGSPAACWTAFTVLAGPLLRHWAGQARPFPAPQRVHLADGVQGRADVPRLLWGEVGPGSPPRAHLAPRREPGALVRLAGANALVVQPAGSGPLPAGAETWALRTDRAGEAGEADARALLSAAALPGVALDPSPGGGRRLAAGTPAGCGSADPVVPPDLGGPPASGPQAAAGGGSPDAGVGPALGGPPASGPQAAAGCGSPDPVVPSALGGPPASGPQAAAPPAVCAVGGRSGHGKTTLIEALAAAFTAAGEPVATLKHHAHGTPLDAPGKDGYRHRAAGARLTVVSGPGGMLWSEAVDGEWPAEAALRALRTHAADLGCRWLLIEGYHRLPLPRVEVLDTTRNTEPVGDPGEGLFLVAAADPSRVAAPAGVSVVARDDVAAVAAAMRRACRA